MFRLLERYQTVLVLAVALALPVLVYRANATDPADARFVDRLIRSATAPIQRLLMSAVGTVSDAWTAYVDVVDARRENGELLRKLHAAEQKNDELQAIAVENAHLRAVLELEAKNPAVESLPANVIGAGTSASARTIDVDRGALDRVARGMVVISDAGLVGIVLRVGWTSSEVMLVADEKLELSATVVRSRARARLKGGGLVPGFSLELSEISRSDDVKPGDRLATSGLGGVFPKGIPIGEIKQVRTPTGAAYRLADVEPFVDFGRLEHVIVLLAAPKEEPLVTPGALLPSALRTEGALDPDGGPSGDAAADAADGGAADRGAADAAGAALDGGTADAAGTARAAAPDGGAAPADAGVRAGTSGPGSGLVDGGVVRPVDGGAVRPVDGGVVRPVGPADGGAVAVDGGAPALDVGAPREGPGTGARAPDAGP